MNKLIVGLNALFIFACNNPTNSHPIKNKSAVKEKVVMADTIPEKVRHLMEIYKDIVAFDGKYLVFSNRKKIMFDDSLNKNLDDLLNSPDVQDMFHWPYNTSVNRPTEDDPGRIRNEEFLKALYGESSTEVRKHLKTLNWCPKVVNETILFSTKNGAFEALQNISNELDKHPEWKKYLSNIGGTFNWRMIKGTNRLSAHSFGITIDINTAYSNYWQWDCDCTDENVKLNYKNQIPMGIVEVFEKNGFIWGGRWKHYDTMHFEYRPELFSK